MTRSPTSFHGTQDRVLLNDSRAGTPMPYAGQRMQQNLRYRFETHYHAYVGALIQRLLEESVRGLLDADTDIKSGESLTRPDGTVVRRPDGTPRPRPEFYEIFFQNAYAPTSLVDPDHPVHELDFSLSGAYAIYNWELFFHAPFTIAVHLSRNQCFADAQRWLHYLFDPTDSSDGPTPERFWKVKPFQDTDVKLIEALLSNLSSNADPVLRAQTEQAIAQWKDTPFRPHAVARYRPSAYMLKTVMAYLDNLIAWGDSLFREYTGESINEATQLYVLAANILGPRPQEVPKKGTVRVQSYRDLRADLDAFSNALRTVETELPFDLSVPPSDTSGDDEKPVRALQSLNSLYFCVPRNDQLNGYWDTVADRLFKIRNSLDLQGVFRQLPLFEPPIDPALLARAVASGVDVASAASGANQPLPLVRFSLLLQKSFELCQEVRTLGNSLLSAIEQEDNERLTVLRAKHERALLGLGEAVRYGQWQESIKAREGIERTRDNVWQRYVYYERLLGREAGDLTLPDAGPLNASDLTEMRLRTTEPNLGVRAVPVDIAQGVEGISGGHKISKHEASELKYLDEAHKLQENAAGLEMIGSMLGMIPQFSAHGTPLGVGVAVGFGGVQLSRMLSLLASSKRVEADGDSYSAGNSARIGAFARREQEWSHQSNLAAGELAQIFKQLRAAQIREAVAKRELDNHQQQTRNAEEVEAFLTDERTGKVTNVAFHAWMKREVRGLYSQCYQLAFDVACKTERALQRELGDRTLTYLHFDHQSGREGLLAGERLYLDLKRMELGWIELNRREHEMTQSLSLLQVDPLALVVLRTTGECTFTIPEVLFDAAWPGHYFRRVKSVAVSVPGVVGPYVGVHCEVTLLKSTVRTSATASAQTPYDRTGTEDARFEDHYGSMESIVTSTAQMDSGMFEPNLRDERYLPFEGAGVESTWRLRLPRELRAFDYATISDVVFHLRYTARSGGDAFASQAISALSAAVSEARAAGSTRLLSVRHEFPVEWARFKGAALGVASLALVLRDEHYPYWMRERSGAVIRRLDLVTRGGTVPFSGNVQVSFGNPSTNLSVIPTLDNTALPPEGAVHRAGFARSDTVALPELTGAFQVQVNNAIDDLWIAVTWGG